MGTGVGIHVAAIKGGSALTYTANYSLKKPETNDYVSPAAFNENADAIDAKLKEHDDHAAAKDNPHEVTAAQVGAAVSASYTAAISTAWTGSAAPYTQAVTVTGLLTTDKQVHITPVYSSSNATALLEKEAWNMIGKAEVTAANTLTFTCFADKPATAINIAVEVIR